MSYVTDIILITKHAEEGLLKGVNNISKVNEWLENQDYPPLKNMIDYWDGGKNPAYHWFCGAINHFFPEKELIEYMAKEIEWEEPGKIVLIIYPEQDLPQIYRDFHDIHGETTDAGLRFRNAQRKQNEKVENYAVKLIEEGVPSWEALLKARKKFLKTEKRLDNQN